MTRRIGIIGAGIGGLTAAAALSADGQEVVVYEQRDEPAAVGAGQGIEDAATLAVLLRGGNIDAALERYSALRRKRTTAIWRQSRVMGRVAQASGPAAVRIRNALLRAAPAALTARAARRMQGWEPPDQRAAYGSRSSI